MTLTKQDKYTLTSAQISKKIKMQLKEEFKGFKFSVRKKSYSMGRSITISLMVSPVKLIKDYTDIPEIAIFRANQRRYTKEEIKRLQTSNYHQLNQYSLKDKFNEEFWCNGVFLTLTGHTILKRIVQIADYYNYDESDSQTDYYCVNFAFHLELGKWNKPFQDGAEPLTPKRLQIMQEETEKEQMKRTEHAKIEQAKKEQKRAKRLEELKKRKPQRIKSQIRDIQSSHAIIGAKGFQVLTQADKDAKTRELLSKLDKGDWKHVLTAKQISQFSKLQTTIKKAQAPIQKPTLTIEERKEERKARQRKRLSELAKRDSNSYFGLDIASDILQQANARYQNKRPSYIS